ncbi:MAG TPA: hypothetical protein ENH82_02285 [bacterium]|nr:hypothetical protein [bacterium]
MSETVRQEMCTRLGVIISAAQIMQSDIAANNLAHIRKQMEEIEQYAALVRIDFNYLTNRTKT